MTEGGRCGRGLRSTIPGRRKRWALTGGDADRRPVANGDWTVADRPLRAALAGAVGARPQIRDVPVTFLDTVTDEQYLLLAVCRRRPQQSPTGASTVRHGDLILRARTSPPIVSTSSRDPNVKT
jgi:hypothetical protein